MLRGCRGGSPSPCPHAPPEAPLHRPPPAAVHVGLLVPRGGWEGTRPGRRPQERLGRRLEEVAKAVGGGYCRLRMPLRLALGVRGTVAGRRLGALPGLCHAMRPASLPRLPLASAVIVAPTVDARRSTGS